MRARKKWIVAATALLAVGLVICGGSFAALGFDVRALNTVSYATIEYEVSEPFEHISINGDTEDIAFAPSEDGRCRIVCREDEKEPHNVRVEANTLVIDKKASGRWHIGIITESPSIMVYLPSGEYGALTVDADTGNVTVPGNFSFVRVDVRLDTGDIHLSASAKEDAILKTDTGKIDLHEMSAREIALSSETGRISVDGAACEEKLEAKTNTGRTDITSTTCAELYSTGDTGSLYLTHVIASGAFHIKRDTGSVHFDGCDAGAIYVETDTGDVTGTLLTDKVFLTQTDTGRIDVPKTIAGGRCEIATDTGDIKVSVLDSEKGK